jgi:hypothetical protein
MKIILFILLEKESITVTHCNRSHKNKKKILYDFFFLDTIEWFRDVHHPRRDGARWLSGRSASVSLFICSPGGRTLIIPAVKLYWKDS